MSRETNVVSSTSTLPNEKHLRNSIKKMISFLQVLDRKIEAIESTSDLSEAMNNADATLRQLDHSFTESEKLRGFINNGRFSHTSPIYQDYEKLLSNQQKCTRRIFQIRARLSENEEARHVSPLFRMHETNEQQIQENVQAQQVLAESSNTNNELKKLLGEISVLGEIFNSLNSLVTEQAENVNHIEDNVERATTSIDLANENLRATAKFSSFGLPIMAGIIGGAVAGPIGLLSGYSAVGLASASIGGFFGYKGVKRIQNKSFEAEDVVVERSDAIAERSIARRNRSESFKGSGK